MYGRIDDLTLHAAARWQARLQAADCTDQERAAFVRWRNEHPLHGQACNLAERTSEHLDGVMADERIQELAARALVSSAREQKAKHARWKFPVSLAAALLLAVIGLHFSIGFMQPVAVAVMYDTAADQRRSVELTDGSTIEMDVATRIKVRLSGSRREIDLIAGRAIFKVAHDASRPFSVVAGGSRTTALGTRFQVQSERGRVIVTLAEGSVAVDGEHNSGWRERLRPGEQLSFNSATAAVSKQTVDVQLITSWLRGRHSFRNTPLVEAVEEVNRYAKTKIRLGDTSLTELRVGGSFIAGDSRLVVEALTTVLPVRAADSGDEIILFRRYE
jgi:transmembrane sensor